MGSASISFDELNEESARFVEPSGLYYTNQINKIYISPVTRVSANYDIRTAVIANSSITHKQEKRKKKRQKVVRILDSTSFL